MDPELQGISPAWHPFGFFQDFHEMGLIGYGCVCLLAFAVATFFPVIRSTTAPAYFSFPLFLAIAPLVLTGFVSILQFYLALRMLPPGASAAHVSDLLNPLLRAVYPVQFGALQSAALLLIHSAIVVSSATDANLFSLTTKDMLTTLKQTRYAIDGHFGSLDDLPRELVESIANVYWRHFEGSMVSAPQLSYYESRMRIEEFLSLRKVIFDYRTMKATGVHQTVLDSTVGYILDVYRHRIPNADNKSPFWRKMQRLVYRDHDRPDLGRFLKLYGAP